MTTDRDCMRNGLEWLLARPISEAELNAIAGNIQAAWPLILERLADHRLAYGIEHGKSVLSSEKIRLRGQNLFRCLERYINHENASHPPKTSQ